MSCHIIEMVPSTYFATALVAIVHILVCFADEMKIEVLGEVPEKCERKSKNYDRLKIHYTGRLLSDDSKFDSSYDHEGAQPFEFQIGVGQVIKGWDQGVLDMCVGEKRMLTIPPELGYGEEGAGQKIPSKSTLMFEIELVDIQDGTPPPNIFKLIDTNGDMKLDEGEISRFITQQMKDADAELDDETSRKQMVSNIFTHEDKDRDGVISHEEFTGPKHDEL